MEVIKFLVFFPCYSEAEIQVTKLPLSTDYTQGKKHPGKYSQICRVNYILFLKFCPHKENLFGNYVYEDERESTS